MEEKCPECGGEVLEIVYGLPEPEMWEKAKRGEAIIGGRHVDESCDRWQCLECDFSWGELDPEN